MKTISMLLMAAFSIVTISAFSQDKAGRKDTTKHTTYYTCPMHDSILATKSGNCPICGMKLGLTKKEQMKADETKSYTCPVHVDMVSKSPGNCSVCGSALTRNLSPKEKMKMEVMKTYSCPMHADETSDKAGKCPKCGMNLTKRKS